MVEFTDKQLVSAKWFFMFLNVGFTGIGSAFIYAGLNCDHRDLAYAGMTLGSFIIVFGLLGCFTVIVRKRSWIHKTYKFGMIACFLGFALLGCFIFCHCGVFNEERKHMMKSMEEYGLQKSYQKEWDETQKNLTCCGMDDYKDWQRYAGFNGSQAVPASCCKVLNLSATEDISSCFREPIYENLHLAGCLDIKRRIKQTKFIIAGSVCLATAAFIIVAIFLGIVLANH